MFKRLRQYFCKHACYVEDLTPRNEKGKVSCYCFKCEKAFVGDYGLQFPVTWRLRPDGHISKIRKSLKEMQDSLKPKN